MSDPKELKKGAVVSATYDMILQVGLRILSFILNAFIVRHVSREVFAVMTVRLHLLYSTGLLLSREAFRRAALSSKEFGEIHKVINLIWIGTLVSGPVCALSWYIWLYIMERPPDTVTTNYNAGVVFMALSVIVEVAAEVPFVLAELQLWSKTKVVIEGLMQVLRSILLAAFVYLWPMQAVFVYGVSHILGSLFYCASYYGLFFKIFCSKENAKQLPVREIRQLFPKWKQGKLLPEVNNELGSLSWSFFKQGWLMEALTEGELYLMNFFPLISLAQQGVYQDRIAAVVRFFSSLIRNMILISIIILTFGWSYSSLLLQLYGGHQLSEGEGTPLMRAQCFYVVFLAINGITESYTLAVMDDAQLSRYNRLLILFSFAYLGTAVIFTQLFGVLGFVFANCINMGLRITYSYWFIHKQYQGSAFHPLISLYIQPRIILIFTFTLVLTAISEKTVYPRCITLHIGFGAMCLMAVIYFLRWEMKPLLEKILQFASKLLSRLGEQNDHYDKEQFSKVLLVDKIHWLLYRI
ncbi:man(5)GlcNAc(2)-PP-dolichol translocation protein RFT1 isoform X2 [Procambarus clarkii]|uniref:man(5)GlcNAc(2)-PP-dolichol translocation protein RFT1 isoform X2 n=1 Tax=Procambarus clarkii TaxID=6728 RepID=UPI0037424DD8